MLGHQSPMKPLQTSSHLGGEKPSSSARAGGARKSTVSKSSGYLRKSNLERLQHDGASFTVAAPLQISFVPAPRPSSHGPGYEIDKPHLASILNQASRTCSPWAHVLLKSQIESHTMSE